MSEMRADDKIVKTYERRKQKKEQMMVKWADSRQPAEKKKNVRAHQRK